MSSPIDPISATGTVGPTGVNSVDPVADRKGDRRRGDRRKPEESKALVPTEEKPSAKPASVSPPPPAAFAAQVLGQPGKKRGLKGGPEVLDTARSTYLSREYSGAKDRRPSPGIRKATEI